MLISKNRFLSVNLASLLLCSNMAYAVTESPQNQAITPTPTSALDAFSDNKSFAYLSILYIKPTSDNLKYGTFVSGLQPYRQSWHYLAIDPDYHPAFELGYNYAVKETPYSALVSWTHLNSNDSTSKQAATGTALETVQFVAPPFEMSPPVFGIKHVDSKVNFAYNNGLIDISKLLEYGSHVQARLLGGLSILNLNQTITTTFSDYAGSPATAYSYATPPDPLFSFELQNVSKYLGFGPNAGVSVQYQTDSGFGVLAQVLGVLTVGTIQAQDNFTSTSTRLVANGIPVSEQEITAPNATQVVFGADGQLGVFYHFKGNHYSNVTIDAGYRMATYMNAISTVNPNTLVQPGTVEATPEFATGTMAIVSTDARSRPFSYNGVFLDVKVDLT
jgi:hypothetical protein